MSSAGAKKHKKESVRRGSGMVPFSRWESIPSAIEGRFKQGPLLLGSVAAIVGCPGRFRKARIR